MNLISIDRLALQWRLKLETPVEQPQIKAISCDYIEFSSAVSHADLERLGPGQFALRVARNTIHTHTPVAWRPVEKRFGTSTQVALEWESEEKRAAFSRDLLLARQSELFSPAGV